MAVGLAQSRMPIHAGHGTDHEEPRVLGAGEERLERWRREAAGRATT